MISISRMRELVEEEREKSNQIIKKRIISNDTNFPITVNANKKGIRYKKDGHFYCKYMSCSQCVNASWYDDDYCNNQKIHFVDKDNIKTTSVYCENYESEE